MAGLSVEKLQQWQQSPYIQKDPRILLGTLAVFLKDDKGIKAMRSGALGPADIDHLLGHENVLKLLISDRGQELLKAGAVDISTSSGRSMLFDVQPGVLEKLINNDEYFIPLKKRAVWIR